MPTSFSISITLMNTTKNYYVFLHPPVGGWQTVDIKRADEFYTYKHNRPLLLAKGLKHKAPVRTWIMAPDTISLRDKIVEEVEKRYGLKT